MLFTPAGLEQSTRLSVAARHAGRFRDAGHRRRSPTSAAASAPTRSASPPRPRVRRGRARRGDRRDRRLQPGAVRPDAVEVRHGDGRRRTSPAVDGALARSRPGAPRAARRRARDPTTGRPRWTGCSTWPRGMPAGVKLGPGLDRALSRTTSRRSGSRSTAMSSSSSLWSGALARAGVGRAALVLRGDRRGELTAAAEADGRAGARRSASTCTSPTAPSSARG